MEESKLNAYVNEETGEVRFMSEKGLYVGNINAGWKVAQTLSNEVERLTQELVKERATWRARLYSSLRRLDAALLRRRKAQLDQ